jgi:hypothetical protein
MSTINDLGESYTDDELRDALASDLAIRANAGKVFGQGVVDRVLPPTRVSTGSQAMSYNAHADTFKVNGASVPASAMTAGKPAPHRIPDNGVHIPHARQQANDRVAWLERELNDVTGYDSNRQPIYRRSDAGDRKLLEAQLVAAKRDRDTVFAETAALEAQRKLDTTVTNEMWQLDAEREERLNTQAVAKADELEVERRARAILAERDKARGPRY